MVEVGSIGAYKQGMSKREGQSQDALSSRIPKSGCVLKYRMV